MLSHIIVKNYYQKNWEMLYERLIGRNGDRDSHEQWWADDLHDSVSENKSVEEIPKNFGHLFLFFLAIPLESAQI